MTGFEDDRSGGAGSRMSYFLAIFLGAWLIFQIQPLMSKLILPWFGGTPQVWTICLLFFQSLLCAGYALAFALARWVPAGWQPWLFVGGLVLAALLPLQPSSAWKPSGLEEPTGAILTLLLVHVGAPYLLLSATGPLLQDWFRRTRPGVSPYPLYALSNAGSLLSLVAYPFLIDWRLSAPQQALLWKGIYFVYVLAAAGCGLELRRRRATLAARETVLGPRPAGVVRLQWFLLAMAPTLLLAAFTERLSVDVGAVPFIWVLPLTIYLLTLIICFSGDRMYSRRVWGGGLIFMLIVTSTLMGYGNTEAGISQLILQLTVYLSMLLAMSMVCHGELVRLKPSAGRLTEFYLIMSAGGAAGGLFVGVLAPRLFHAQIELPLGLLGGFGLFLWICYRDPRSSLHGMVTHRANWLMMALVLIFLTNGVVREYLRLMHGSYFISRNFYGMLRIVQVNHQSPPAIWFELIHGATRHGSQFVDEARSQQPTTYYGPTSGVGLAMTAHHADRPRRIGVIGLGVGTMAAYGKPGDFIEFFDINPLVIDFSQNFFSYLSHCPADVEIVQGDARLSLERLPPQHFDLLIVDAFSSDAIPIHLLTEEALEIYFNHLQTDGILAVHVSNRFFDLKRVLAAAAQRRGASYIALLESIPSGMSMNSSEWVLLCREPAPLRDPRFQALESPYPRKLVHWTDSHSSLFSVLH